MGNRAFRQDDFKLVAAAGEEWELHDLARDRTESRNLAASEPRRLAEMKEAYADWARRTGVLPWPVQLNGTFG